MPVTTIDEVLVRLQSLDETLQADDGVRWFNHLYLGTTTALRDYCRAGKPKAPPFLERLDVFFGNAFFDALDAADGGGTPPRCWAPLFEARHDRRIAPLQFALAGMNAHIGHDLAVGIVATCEALGIVPAGDSPQHADYEAVNAIMREIEGQAKQWLLTGAIKELDHVVARLDDVAAIWSVERARDAGWTRSEVLWHLREHHELSAAYLAALDGTVGMECRALLLPHGV